MKKVIAILLVAAMFAGLLPLAAFAEDEPEKFSIVALGDSTTNGYFLDDFGEYSDYDGPRTWWYDYASWAGMLDFSSKHAYPALLRDYLAGTMPDKDVTLTPLGISGMRSDEIRKFLDPSFELDKPGKVNVDNYTGAYLSCFGLDPYELYPDAVRGADLITLDCCMNNFLDYFLCRISAVLSGDEYKIEYYNDKIELTTPGADKLVSDITNMLSGFLPDGMVKGICDAFAYCYCDFCTNFSNIIRLIRGLNTKAQIIVCGPFNPFTGIVLDYNGVGIDLGDLFAILMGLVDTYITVLDENHGSYNYVNLSFGLDTANNVIAKAKSVEGLTPAMLERFVKSIYDTTSYVYLAGSFRERVRALCLDRGITYSYMTVDDVLCAYDDVKQNGDSASEFNKLICDVHNEFFDLIIKGAAVNRADLGELLGILTSGGIGSLDDFGGIAFNMLGRDFDDFSSGEKAVFRVISMGMIASGVGVHPSEKGCRQKFEAVKCAYLSNRPAKDSAAGMGIGLGIHAANAFITAIANPLLQSINGLFAKIDIHGIFESLGSFFLRFIPIR